MLWLLEPLACPERPEQQRPWENKVSEPTYRKLEGSETLRPHHRGTRMVRAGFLVSLILPKILRGSATKASVEGSGSENRIYLFFLNS